MTTSAVRPPLRTTAGRLVLAAGLGALWATLTLLMSQAGWFWAVNVAIVVPGIVLGLLDRRQWRKAYRWVAIWAIAQVIYPFAVAAFLTGATAWGIYRARHLERAPRAASPAMSDVP